MVESKHILFTIGKYIIFFTHIQYKGDTYSIQMTRVRVRVSCSIIIHII